MTFPIYITGLILLMPLWAYAIRFQYKREKREYLKKRNRGLYRDYAVDYSANQALFVFLAGGAALAIWFITIPIAIAVFLLFVVGKYLYSKLSPTLDKIDSKVEDKLNKWIEN